MGYTVNGVQYDYDSHANQKIKREFVDREVLCCMTSEVEYILRQSIAGNIEDIPFTNDDVENYYKRSCEECGWDEFEELTPEDETVEIKTNEDGKYLCPVCGTEWNTESEARECCSSETLYRCSYCDKLYTPEEYENMEENPQEVYEWWAVTNWLGEKLRDFGEVVIECWGHWYWGRCCTGQAISLDYIISRICHNMGILEGQEYSWEKKVG